MDVDKSARTARKPPRPHPYQRLKQIRKTVLSAVRDEELALFACDACKNLLRHPVTVKCGHTICTECLGRLTTKCGKCHEDIEETRPKVNILVQTLIEKWKERNKIDQKDLPMVMLLLHPRYILRSGCAGLQCTVDIQRNLPNKQTKPQGFEVNFPRKQLYARIANRRKCPRSLDGSEKKNEWDRNSLQRVMDAILDELKIAVEKALRKTWSCITAEDVECLLCRRCFLDPVTTPCGHTFCRDCLTRVLDHRLTCPLCVSKLSVGDYFRGTTRVLHQAVQLLFPDKVTNEHPTGLKEAQNNSRSSIDVPVFVCTNAFPGVACPLYVYEPRYRLLVRRCLQSATKRFAMASMDRFSTKFTQYGTILEVKDAVTLEDGRFILSTQGIRRFKVISRSEKDGYDTARVDYICDITPSPENMSSLIALHGKVYSRAVRWVQLLAPSALSEVERLIGKMPRVEKNWITLPDGPSWIWWLIPILPLSPQLQVGFLSSTSLEKRLRAIDKMLEHMKIRMKAMPRQENVSYVEQNEAMVFCSE